MKVVQMLMSPAIVSRFREISRVEITYIIQFVIDANWGRIDIKPLSIIYSANVSFQWMLSHRQFRGTQWCLVRWLKLEENILNRKLLPGLRSTPTFTNPICGDWNRAMKGKNDTKRTNLVEKNWAGKCVLYCCICHRRLALYWNDEKVHLVVISFLTLTLKKARLSSPVFSA